MINRRQVWAHFMRSSPAAITKAELLAAVDATDQWIDDNASSFNTALPLAARTGMNLVQKTLLFCFVAMRRAGTLRVEGD